MTDQTATISTWDVNSALSNTDDCIADLKELLEIWMRQAPRLVDEIRTALEKDDAQQLMHAAHTLKGSLQILCADKVCWAALELEKTGKTGNTTGGVALLAALEHQLSEIRPKIVDFIEAN